MDANNGRDEASPEPTNSGDSADGERSQPACPLSIRQQNRNLVRYAVHMSLIYLAAPVVYVGNLDAILLNKLEYSDTIANLPATAFMWTTAPVLVLFTWYFCYVRMLKPVLVASYAVSAAAGLIVVVGLLEPQSHWLVAALAIHATLTGWSLGVANLFEWEILARGVAEQRRGLALSLAFGLGPFMAVLSSLGTQLVLDGTLASISRNALGFPRDFLALFAASVFIMAVPAISATRYLVPVPATETLREPLWSGVFGGLGEFLRNRLLMVTTLAFLLVVLGHDTVLPSVTLYTKEAIGEEAQKYLGYQFALQFSFKVVAGLLLGWMLVKTHPRAGLTATTVLCLGGLVWALAVSGRWYLVSFGILGAGELYYVYYQNYLISCSPTSMVRRNLAYSNLLALPVTSAPLVFGLISDNYGLRCSIELAAILLAGTVLLVQIALPRWPRISAARQAPSDEPTALAANL
jgi:hypothetical protein